MIVLNHPSTLNPPSIVWPAVCPLPIPGSHGGSDVQVEGSFDNWTTRQVLQRSGKEYTIVKLLPPGVYQVRMGGGGL